jgi:glycerol uptake facilitator-like aquaporin
VIITIFAPICGAHFNPTVSLVMAIRGNLDRREALAYMRADRGRMSRCPVRPSDVGLDPFQLSTTERTGLPQWLPEFVATFGLLITILGCVRFRPDAVALAYWFTASTSFANPAVTIARSLSDTFAGIAPWDVPGFMVAQVLAALAAAALGGWLFARRRAA